MTSTCRSVGATSDRLRAPMPLFRTDPRTGPPAPVSTGHLPPIEQVRAVLGDAHLLYRADRGGTVAGTVTDIDRFGASVSSVSGQRVDAGAATDEFPLLRISAVFVFAIVCDAIGGEPARQLGGAIDTDQSADSASGNERVSDSLSTALAGRGALTTTSAVPAANAEERWERIRAALSAFAGRPLALDLAVYASTSASNRRNREVAELLADAGRLGADPAETTDVFTKQRSLSVNCRDLSLMAATLAGGGVNPVTGEQVVSADTCQHVLALLATNGFREHSGDWLYEVGLPAGSATSGAIIAVAPGKAGLATFSPPLDAAGISVRGQLLTKYVAERLGLNVFKSAAGAPATEV